jgi:hypothetical protein
LILQEEKSITLLANLRKDNQVNCHLSPDDNNLMLLLLQLIKKYLQNKSA